jgi:hypothetical protein
MDFTPPPLEQKGLKLVFNGNIVYKNLKSENSRRYAQKPQRNGKFMNSTSAQGDKYSFPKASKLSFNGSVYEFAVIICAKMLLIRSSVGVIYTSMISEPVYGNC